MRVALDIETECKYDCEKACDHALEARHNRITVVGMHWEGGAQVFRGPRLLDDVSHAITQRLYNSERTELVGHNLKWDLRQLAHHDLDLSHLWADDTLLMASALSEKIPDRWLANYAAKRKALNAKLPRGYSHRAGTPNSLKTLAPYHLGVEPFWEDPTNHDSDEYVLADCRYTFQLADVLERKLRQEGSYDFYRNKLVPWTRLLLRMERRGVALDLAAMDAANKAAQTQAEEAKAQLDTAWSGAYAAWAELVRREESNRYFDMFMRAAAKTKNREKCVARYRKLQADALAKLDVSFNLNSPAQLKWLLRDHLGHDIYNFEGEESTGKVVLKRLALTDPAVATFVKYRQQSKLVSAFFPAWREMHHSGIMHCTFHPAQNQQEGQDDENGTRTGRLSSSNPNLQQVPGHLHRLFVARPGYKLITRDMSAIEPRLIAYFTHDPNLYNIVASGDDFHGHSTRVLFEADWDIASIKKLHARERDLGKRFGLMAFYGSGARGLQRTAQSFGIFWSERECYRKMDAFKEYYAGVYRYRDEVINPALERGERMTNLLGRPIIVDPDNVYMTGLNTKIQGSASDLVQESARDAQAEYDARGLDAHVLLLVHDEIIVEAPEAVASLCDEILNRHMTKYQLMTPMGPVKLTTEGKIADAWEK